MRRNSFLQKHKEKLATRSAFVLLFAHGNLRHLPQSNRCSSWIRGRRSPDFIRRRWGRIRCNRKPRHSSLKKPLRGFNPRATLSPSPATSHHERSSYSIRENHRCHCQKQGCRTNRQRRCKAERSNAGAIRAQASPSHAWGS